MANKITVLLDLVTDKAQASAKGFRSAIADAEGATNKFKAGASSAFQTIQANAGLLAASAGAALVTFGAKAVQASQETALAAGKLADATGLTVEAASRLQEVGSDLGVSGETITAVVKKMTVELGKGNPLLDEYGIALQHTDDGAADLNATLIDTIRRIGQIEDPTKRAAAAQAAFGRGYAEAAELIFSNADQLQEKLDAVSNAKVITPEELERAREFRDAMEDLKDIGEDLAVSLGKVVIPAISGMISGIRSATESLSDSGHALRNFITTGNITSEADKIEQAWEDSSEAASDFDRTLLDGLTTFDQVRNKVLELTGDVTAANIVSVEWNRTHEATEVALDDVTEALSAADAGWQKYIDANAAGLAVAEGAPGTFDEMAAAAEAALGDIGDAATDAADDLDPLAEAIQGVRDAIDEAFGGLEDDLDLLDLFDDIQEQFEKIAEAAKEANDPAGIRDFNREVRTLQEQLLDMVRTRDDLSAKEQIEFVARIRQGDIDELHRVLDDLTKDRFVNITPVAPQHDAFHSLNASLNPTAGTATPIFNQPSGPSSSSIINQTIIYPVGSTPTTTYQNQIIDDRRNGAR